MSFLLRLHPKGYPEQCKINNWLWLLHNALNLPKTPPLRLTDAHNPSANPQPANEVDSFSATKGRPAPHARRPLHTCAGLTSAELPFLDPKLQAWTESHTLFPPTAFYPPPLSPVTGGPLRSAPAARPAHAVWPRSDPLPLRPPSSFLPPLPPLRKFRRNFIGAERSGPTRGPGKPSPAAAPPAPRPEAATDPGDPRPARPGASPPPHSRCGNIGTRPASCSRRRHRCGSGST